MDETRELMPYMPIASFISREISKNARNNIDPYIDRRVALSIYPPNSRVPSNVSAFVMSKLFYLARIEKLVFHRNSEEVRSFLIVYYDKTRLIRRSVYPSDCISLISQDKIGPVTDDDLKTLQY